MFNFPCDKCATGFAYQYQLDNHMAQRHTELFTADDVKVYDGMPVWDYNLDVVEVDLSSAKAEPNGDIWFGTKTPTGGRGSLMNGERIVTRHPITNTLASDAWDKVTRPVNLVKVTVDLTWPDGSQFTWSGVSEDKVEQLTELLGHIYDLKV